MDPLRQMAEIASELGFAFDDKGTAKAIIEDSGGDPVVAVLRLVRVNHYLMRENGTLLRRASPGLMRGSGGHRS
jgi:hypothetical protein